MAQTIRNMILQQIAEYCAATGISERALGVAVLNDSHMVRKLKIGRGTQLSSLERLEEYMSANPASLMSRHAAL